MSLSLGRMGTGGASGPASSTADLKVTDLEGDRVCERSLYSLS